MSEPKEFTIIVTGYTNKDTDLIDQRDVVQQAVRIALHNAYTDEKIIKVPNPKQGVPDAEVTITSTEALGRALANGRVSMTVRPEKW